MANGDNDFEPSHEHLFPGELEPIPVDSQEARGQIQGRQGFSEDLVPVLPVHDEDIPDVLPAPKAPHPNFGWSLLWCLGFLAVLWGAMIAVFLTAAIFKKVFEPEPPIPNASSNIRATLEAAIPAAMFVSELISGLFAFVIVRQFVGSDWMRILGLRRPSLSQLILILTSLPALLIVPNLIHKAAQEMGVPSFQSPEELAKLLGGMPLGFAILVVAVAPGLGEELWCRGFLGRGLVGNYGAWIGILVTSLIFGALHIDPAHAVAVSFMGIWLHFVYLTSRSLWMPMLLHTLNNSAAVISVFVGNQLESDGTQSLQPGAVNPILDFIFSCIQILDRSATDNPYLVFVAAICLLFAVAWALYRGRTRLVIEAKNPGVPWRPDYPGVEYPPPRSGTTVFRPWPGWAASAIVLAGVLVFALSIYLAPTAVIP